MRKVNTFAALFVIFSAAFLVGAIALSCANQNFVIPTISLTSKYKNWKTYSNLTYNFALKYPKNWSVAEEKEQIVLISPDFSYGATPQKKIEKGFFVTIKVLPVNSVAGYSGDETFFAEKEEIKIGKWNGIEYIVKNIDEVQENAPAEIQFKTDNNLILIDGWFSSQDKDEFIGIFENIAQSFKII